LIEGMPKQVTFLNMFVERSNNVNDGLIHVIESS
jgi:hypothetical protein